MIKKIFLLLILSFLFITSSCIIFKSDATDVDKYWLPLDKNKTYVLTKSVFLTRVGSDAKTLALVPPSSAEHSRFYSSPPYIDENSKTPDLADIEPIIKGTVGVIKKDTIIVPYKISKEMGYSFMVGFFSYPKRFLQIRSGPLTGVVVEAEDVLNWAPELYVTEASPPIHDSVVEDLRKTNAFRFSGKSKWNFIVMFLAAAGIVLLILSIIHCFRRKDFSVKQKILWTVALCFGLLTFRFNWTDGSVDFKWFSFLFPFVSIGRPLIAGPYIFSFSLPVFLIVYLDKRFNLTKDDEKCSKEESERNASGS
jgi:hypothetical protein